MSSSHLPFALRSARPPFVVSLSNHERFRRGGVSYTLPARSMAARGHLLFGIAQKVGKKASPRSPLLPPVLATAGRRRNRPNVALRATSGLMLRRLDRPLLRSSARAKGAVELKFDRFAMGAHTTRTRFASPGYSKESVASMQRSGIEDWWQDGETPTSGINSVPHRSPGASTRVRAFHREAIKLQFDGVPMDLPRGAERRAVVDPHHEPTGCASAQLSGDLCGSRALRAPEESGESLGSPSFGHFSWRSKKSDWPARPRSALVAYEPLHSIRPFDKLRANGGVATARAGGTHAC